MDRIKVTVLSLSMLTVMAGAAVAPALGTISQEFSSVPETMIKLIITLPALMIIATSFLFGQLVTRLAPKTITILGLGLYVVGGACAGFAGTIHFLLFCRMLLGIGVGLVMPLSTGLLSFFFDRKEQQKLMGYSSAMNNLGGIIATSLSGILAAVNWRMSFLIYLLGLVVLIMILLNLPNISFHEKTQDGTHKSPKLDKGDVRVVLPFALCVFISMVVFYAMPTNFSMIAQKTGTIPVAWIGIVMSVNNAVAVFVGMKLVRILGFLGKSAPYLGALAMAGGFLLESIVSRVDAAVAGLILIGLGIGILFPVLNAQIAQKIHPVKVASAMSMMSAFLFLGQFLSPILIDTGIGALGLSMIQAPYYLAAGAAFILVGVIAFLPMEQNAINPLPLEIPGEI